MRGEPRPGTVNGPEDREEVKNERDRKQKHIVFEELQTF